MTTGPIGGREPLKDVARNLDRWTNAIVAHWSSVPVINELSDRCHRCQAVADVSRFRKNSAMATTSRMSFSIATSAGYEPDAEIVAQAQLNITNDPKQSPVIYPDVRTGMGRKRRMRTTIRR